MSTSHHSLIATTIPFHNESADIISFHMQLLVDIIFILQGIISLYISTIHNQAKAYPFHAIDYLAIASIGKDNDV